MWTDGTTADIHDTGSAGQVDGITSDKLSVNPRDPREAGSTELREWAASDPVSPVSPVQRPANLQIPMTDAGCRTRTVVFLCKSQPSPYHSIGTGGVAFEPLTRRLLQLASKDHS